MTHRIAPSGPLVKPPKRVENADYLDWIRSQPCVVCLSRPVDAAHLSTANPLYGHPGRGKQRRVSDRWALPLCRKCHNRQHSMAEMDFWRSYKTDPHILALTLHGLWNEGADNLDYRALEIICLHSGM